MVDEKMPKVSVIVPVYGVEKYIDRCARSLFEQTLDDMEYIFVNDATTDKSIEILEKVINDFPERKSQVTVLHHERNLGLPQARKTGIMHAKGHYIAHCDSDDWVDKDMYRSLYETAVRENSDLVVCDYSKARTNGCRSKKGCRTIDKGKFLEDLIYKKSSWSLCNKLYNRSLFAAGIQYPVCSMAEDMAMTIQIICRAQKISYVPKTLYYYYIYPSSMVRTKNIEHCLASYQQQKENTDIVLKVLDDNKKEILYSHCWGFLQYLCSINMTPLAYHDNYCLRKWREFCPSLGVAFFLNGKIAFRHKFKYAKLSAYYFFKVRLTQLLQ